MRHERHGPSSTAPPNASTPPPSQRTDRRMAHRRDRDRPGNATDARPRRTLTLLCHPMVGSRRRRAKVRVERMLESLARNRRAVGLAGSQVMSALVDVWGWRARLRLARGQTINDVIAKIPALESGLGTFRGAVRVYPTPDDLANRCELRVLDIDPHADAIPWPGPSVTPDHRTNRPRPVRRRGPVPGPVPSPPCPVRRGDRRGQEQRPQRADGQPGRLPRCGHLGHRPQEGHGAGPVGTCIDRLATTPDEARALLADAVTVLEARAALLAEQRTTRLGADAGDARAGHHHR